MLGNLIDAAAVDSQLETGRVLVDDIPTALDIVHGAAAERTPAPDGPLRLTGARRTAREEEFQEVMVWMKGGLVVMAELLSYSDEPPQDWPDPGTLEMLDLHRR